jgi:hypothetical protein
MIKKTKNTLEERMESRPGGYSVHQSREEARADKEARRAQERERFAANSANVTYASNDERKRL